MCFDSILVDPQYLMIIALEPLSLLSMASARRSRTVARGTSCPDSMIEVRFLPLSEPEATSSLSRSPEERWVKPYLATILSH